MGARAGPGPGDVAARPHGDRPTVVRERPRPGRADLGRRRRGRRGAGRAGSGCRSPACCGRPSGFAAICTRRTTAGWSAWTTGAGPTARWWSPRRSRLDELPTVYDDGEVELVETDPASRERGLRSASPRRRRPRVRSAGRTSAPSPVAHRHEGDAGQSEEESGQADASPLQRRVGGEQDQPDHRPDHGARPRRTAASAGRAGRGAGRGRRHDQRVRPDAAAPGVASCITAQAR